MKSPDGDKAAEALLVREAYDKMKRERRGYTQGQLAREFGATQGLIQGWLSGATRIPDRNIFRLAKMLEFDPIEVRPTLQTYIDAARYYLEQSGNGNPPHPGDAIMDIVIDMTDDEIEMVHDFALMVKNRRQK